MRQTKIENTVDSKKLVQKSFPPVSVAARSDSVWIVSTQPFDPALGLGHGGEGGKGAGWMDGGYSGAAQEAQRRFLAQPCSKCTPGWGKDGANREQRAQGEGLPASYFSPAGCLLQVRRNAPVLANSVVASNQMAQEFSTFFCFFSILSTPVFFPSITAFITRFIGERPPSARRCWVTDSRPARQGSVCPSIKRIKCAALGCHPLFLSP